jgi:hypothetical protein
MWSGSSPVWAATSTALAQVYPGTGIALSTGSAWGTSITDNSANWNTAYGWGNYATAFNGLFDNRLSATTTLPNITTLVNLAINNGNWSGTDLSVANGGTGASTLTGLLQGNGTGAITGIGGTTGQFPYFNGTNTLSATSSLFIATNNNVGIGSTTPFYKLSIGTNGSLYGSIVTVENKLATTTSMTVDWTQSNQQLVQIGTAATTIGFSNVVNGATLRLMVCNPNAVAGALTFTGVEWVNATLPTQTTTANVCDAWSFIATQATSTSAGSVKIFGAMSPNFP